LKILGRALTEAEMAKVYEGSVKERPKFPEPVFDWWPIVLMVVVGGLAFFLILWMRKRPRVAASRPTGEHGSLLRQIARVLLLVFGTIDCDAAAKPNFIFILADDLGGRDLGCYGSTFHETPNLDRFAASGMRFTQAYAACSVCSPTRASILTGK